MINTTRLLRRCDKYLTEHRGGKAQTGETALGVAGTGDGAFLRSLRRGAAIREPKLAKMDEFLSSKGY